MRDKIGLTTIGIAVLSLFILYSNMSCGEKEEVIPDAIRDTSSVKKENNATDIAVHKDGETYDTYQGLVMAGYQGWFGAPGDGCTGIHGSTYYHYRNNGYFKPGPLKSSIDFWPETSEYEKTYKTAFTLPDGSSANVFSSYDESSVSLHFKWMKDYGIDGVFMQRFVGEVIGNSSGKDHFDTVLDHAMKASNTYQRAICVMYDLSGAFMNSGKGVDNVVADAKAIMDKYRLTDRSAGQKYYLYENGKPLICVWGVGFNDGRKYTTKDCESLVDGLKDLGYSVMLGVPTHWRTLSGDTMADSSLHTLIKKCDAFFPWYVGRYDNSSVEGFASHVKSDVEWAASNNIVFAALCFPGFSWQNMYPSGSGSIPRNGGDFFWKQVYNAINSGAKCIYIAMFDEIDEGTAIFKCLKQSDVPSNEPNPDYYVCYKGGSYSISSSFVSSADWCKKASELGINFQGIENNLQPDHYLWLAGQAGKMLRGEIALSSSQPSR